MNKLTHQLASRAASAAAILLLPSMAATESRVQTAVPNAPLAATAHVNFKIVIPTVLSLEVGTGVGTGGDHTLGAETVSIISNSHNVTLNAAVRTSDSPARGNVILSGAFGKIIARDAQCSLGPGRAASAPGATKAGPAKAGTQQLLCTVSIP